MQKIQMSGDVGDKKGKKLPVYFSGWSLYWEAWKVNKGKKVTQYAQQGYPYDDEFASDSYGDFTYGTLKVTGSAIFYEGLTLPQSFKPNYSSPAGILPVTKADPHLTGGCAPDAHNLTATWDCRGKNKKTGLTVQ